jgi:hypothetical protein
VDDFAAMGLDAVDGQVAVFDEQGVRGLAMVALTRHVHKSALSSSSSSSLGFQGPNLLLLVAVALQLRFEGSSQEEGKRKSEVAAHTRTSL